VLEQFSRSILPSEVPLWQLFFFLSVLPAVCEEIGFRGTLLYGLRHRFRPAALALAVGAVFGLFHVALFRIIPTGFLGVVLTAIALLTGSIFPGMVIHAGSNAFGLWAGLHEFPLARLDWWVYAAAGIAFILSFYIVYRNRTPYPGLRI
jgi:membrane protease YdiL (CAAX protease family)